MKHFFISFCIIYLAFGCIGKKEKPPILNLSHSSEEIVTTNESTEDDLSYNEILNEYISSYNKKIKIDTSINGELFVNLEHYCLYDNGIKIPEKYNWGQKKEVFLTHNFASKLLILNDQKQVLISKIIVKKDFEQLLSEELRKYGVLLYPTFRNYDNERQIFQIHYSISIPLTDIGQSVILEVGLNGNIRAISD